MEWIGRYEIVSELGRGAMGIVYRARDPKIGRDLAIKTIKLDEHVEADESSSLRQRLFREAQLAGSLSHPSIVTIYDVDEQDDLTYITMELVEGRKLSDLLADGKSFQRTLGFVTDFLQEAGAALDYANGRKIIHRDIKPANIMLSSNGIKIMDFGVARISSSRLTRTGTVVGTPSYMSPEQIKGDSLDGRSDQFSLAVIAYELLTGKKPFEAESLTTTLFKVVSEDPPPPGQFNKQVNSKLEHAVLRALSKDPDERFKSCSAFANAVAAAIPRMDSGQQVAALLAGLNREADEQDVTAESLPVMKSAATEATIDTLDEVAPVLLPVPAHRREQEDTQEQHTETSESPPPLVRWPMLIILLLVIAAASLVFILINRPQLLNDPQSIVEAVFDTTPPARDSVSEPETDAGSSAGTTATPPDVAVSENPEPAEFEPSPAAEELLPEIQDEQPESGTVNEVVTTAGESPLPDVGNNISLVSPVQSEPPVTIPATVPVFFQSRTPGVQVVVNNRADLRCNTPCGPLDLVPGEHTLLASREGSSSQRRTFTVAGKSATINIQLREQSSTLVITSVPKGGRIFLNGLDTGRFTNTDLSIPSGTHVIRIEKGDLRAEQTIEVETGMLQHLDVLLGRP